MNIATAVVEGVVKPDGTLEWFFWMPTRSFTERKSCSRLAVAIQPVKEDAVPEDSILRALHPVPLLREVEET